MVAAQGGVAGAAWSAVALRRGHRHRGPRAGHRLLRVRPFWRRRQLLVAASPARDAPRPGAPDRGTGPSSGRGGGWGLVTSVVAAAHGELDSEAWPPDGGPHGRLRPHAAVAPFEMEAQPRRPASGRAGGDRRLGSPDTREGIAVFVEWAPASGEHNPLGPLGNSGRRLGGQAPRRESWDRRWRTAWFERGSGLGRHASSLISEPVVRRLAAARG